MDVPIRWTSRLLDSIVGTLEGASAGVADVVAGRTEVQGVDENVIRSIRDAISKIEPYFTPIVTELDSAMDAVVVDPRVAAAVQVLSAVLPYRCNP